MSMPQDRLPTITGVAEMMRANNPDGFLLSVAALIETIDEAHLHRCDTCELVESTCLPMHYAQSVALGWLMQKVDALDG